MSEIITVGLDLALDARCLAMDVPAFDGADCLDAAEGRFGRSQGSKALAIAKQPLQRGVVALDQIVSPLSIDMPDAVKVRIILVIDLSDDAPIAMRLVRHDRSWPVQANTLDGLVEEGPCRPGVASQGKAEVDHLAVGIDGAPEIAPLATDANVGFVDMPVDTRTAQVFLGSPGQFGAELLNPAIDGRPINGDIALGQEIDHILIG